MSNDQKTPKRAQWASRFGFLMAAIGSAVGLGNIWGFPFKMGKNGGGAFFIIYLVLALCVGSVLMLGELTLGRSTGLGVVGAYRKLAKKFSWLGFIALVGQCFILAFYAVIGGIVFRYMIYYFMQLCATFAGTAEAATMSSGAFFGSFICNGKSMMFYYALFAILNMFVVALGVNAGIERFNKYALPTLALIMAGLAAYVLTLPNAVNGLVFMFKPDFSVFKSSQEFFKVFKAAAGQMFFSLSLGVGCMITYGSYLSKENNLSEDMFIIPAADTLMAVLAGVLVMPACFAFSLPPAAGPSLVFVSLHEVFMKMGGIAGALVGFLFYFLVFLAALSSSVSMLETCVAHVEDNLRAKGRSASRLGISFVLAVLVFLLGVPVALDGFGSGVVNGASLNNPAQMLGLATTPPSLASWLDFYDMLSEGTLMPFGSVVMSLLIGWKLGLKFIRDEVERTPGAKLRFASAINFGFCVVVPVVISFVLYWQLKDFGLI